MEDKDFLKDKLVNLYEQDPSVVDKMTLEEMGKLCNKIEKGILRQNKNPNKFWILKSLPEPKVFKTKTSSKAGIFVFIAFICIFVLFGCLMFYLAFSNN